MSAFVVHPATIDAIVTWAAQNQVSVWREATRDSVRIDTFNAQEIGAELWAENVRSVEYRYKDSAEPGGHVNAYVYKMFATPLTPIEVIKLCRCLNYQSCETEDWEATFACRVLETVVTVACGKLPGFEKAPWGLSGHDDKSLTHAGAILLTSLVRRR